MKKGKNCLGGVYLPVAVRLRQEEVFRERGLAATSSTYDD